MVYIILVFPEHSLDDADDLRLAAVDWLVGLVLRHQPDLPLLPGQAFDGGLVPDPGHNDLTIVCIGLGPDHNLVPGEDAGVPYIKCWKPERRDESRSRNQTEILFIKNHLVAFESIGLL